MDGGTYVMTGTWRTTDPRSAEDPAVLDSFDVDDSRQAEGIITMTLTPEQTNDLPDRSVWDLENVSEDTTIGTHTWLMGSLATSRATSPGDGDRLRLRTGSLRIGSVRRSLTRAHHLLGRHRHRAPRRRRGVLQRSPGLAHP